MMSHIVESCPLILILTNNSQSSSWRSEWGWRFTVRMRPTSTWTAPPWRMLWLTVPPHGTEASSSLLRFEWMVAYLGYTLRMKTCGRLSWLPVSFLLHVKHTLSYRISWLTSYGSWHAYEKKKWRLIYDEYQFVNSRELGACRPYQNRTTTH